MNRVGKIAAYLMILMVLGFLALAVYADFVAQ